MELIDRLPLEQDAFEVWTREYGNITVVAMDAIDNAPTVDAAPVAHARWETIPGDERNIGRCSGCKLGGAASWAFCPHCGATMDAKNIDVPTDGATMGEGERG